MNANPQWREPPPRYTGMRSARPEPQSKDPPFGALAVFCFLLGVVLVAIFIGNVG